jgi:DNA gyrase/topoisomerase IV subunit A
MDLKIRDLSIQIPNKKTELEKIITETKTKLTKAENYLLEQIIVENLNSERLTELKEILSEYQSEIETILNQQQEINNLQKHLEYLQKNQLLSEKEAKIEISYLPQN